MFNMAYHFVCAGLPVGIAAGVVGLFILMAVGVVVVLKRRKQR